MFSTGAGKLSRALVLGLAVTLGLAGAGCVVSGWGPPAIDGVPAPEPEPEPDPVPDPNPCAPPYASVAMVPDCGGQTPCDPMGPELESWDAIVYNSSCASGPLRIANSCCEGPLMHLQRLTEDGTWEDRYPQVLCACAGESEPLLVPVGGEERFWATPFETNEGPGWWRWIFTVSRCEDLSCPEDLASPDFWL